MAYDAEIRIGTSIDTSQMQKLQIQINKTTDKAAGLAQKLEELKNKKIPTTEYKEVQKQIEETESKLNKLLAKKEDFKGSHKSASWLNMTSEIDELQASLPYLKGELQELVDTGKAFTLGKDTEEYTKASKSFAYAQSELRALNTKQDEMIAKQQKAADKFTTLSKKGQKTYRGLASVIKGGLIKSFDTLKDKASKAFKSIHSGTKKSSGLFTDMKNRLKGIALSLFVFNWITKAFNSIVSGINDGLKNLAGVSEETNKKMSDLKTSLTYLKNSFTAAFAPILETVIPVLTTLMNTLSNAINYVGMFFAALTGKSSYYKAKKVQEDYTESLEDTTEAAEETKEALGGLAGFDDIELLPTQTDTGNKDKDKDKDKDKNTEDMFEEVPIASDLQNLADRLKDLIEKGDWESIGSLIAEKLNGAMQNIQWDSIQESARNVAVNIANFINGFVKTFDWSLLGYNIAQGLNTALTFLNTLITTLDWGALGAALYNCLNSIVLNFDWSLLGQTLANGINGVFNFLYSAITGFDFAKLAASITTFINTAVTEIDWQLVAATIGEGINALLSFIVTFITTLDWGAIGEAIYTSINTFFLTIDWAELGTALSSGLLKVIEMLRSILQNVDWNAIGQDIATFLASVNWGSLLANIGGLIVDAVIAGIELASGTFPKATSAIISFIAAWEITKLLAFIQTSGGVVSAISNIVTVLLGATAAKIADKAETIAITALYAKDFVVSLVNSTAALVKQAAQFAINTAAKIADTAAQVAMTAATAAWNAICVLATAATTAFGTAVAFLTSPMGIAVVAIAGLVTAGVLLWKNWDTICAKAKQIWGKIIETIGKAIDGIIGFFKGVIEFIKGLFTKDWTESFGVLGHVLDAFFENVENVFEDVKQIFEGIVDFITGVFSGDWEKAISGLVNIFAGVWGLLTDIAKAPINIIIGFINTMIDAMIGTINFFIESLNKLSFDVPDWVPLIGGKKFGFNFTTVSAPQIPYLAQGAVIPPNQQFLAMLGDQTHGRNLEAPEGLIRQIFREESSSNQMPANITLKFSGDLSGLARLLKPELDAESSRLGISLVTDIG